MKTSAATRNSPRAPAPITDSSLRCQTVRVGSRRTSVRLEPEMWDALAAITEASGLDLSTMLSAVDLYRQQSSLTSAVRVFILKFYRAAAEHPTETPRLWVDIAIRGPRGPALRKQA